MHPIEIFSALLIAMWDATLVCPQPTEQHEREAVGAIRYMQHRGVPFNAEAMRDLIYGDPTDHDGSLIDDIPGLARLGRVWDEIYRHSHQIVAQRDLRKLATRYNQRQA